MKKAKSIIHNLPIRDFNRVLDRLGLAHAWYSILATHVRYINRADLRYILGAKEFRNTEIQDLDFIDGLSIGEISVLYEYSLRMSIATSGNRKDSILRRMTSRK